MASAQDKKSARAARSRKKRISKLLSKIGKNFDTETPKATLADFIRLTQLERELEQEEQPAEVIVRWEEPAEKQDIER